MSAAVAKAVEPTMEEILASIRRIIADDQKSPPVAPERAIAPPPVTVPQSAPPPKPRLVEPVAAVAAAAMVETSAVEIFPAETRPPYPTPYAREDRSFVEDVAATEPPLDALPSILTAVPPPSLAEAPADETSAEPLLSGVADDAVAQSFGALAHAHLAHNLPPLETIIRDMLRPMLKTWLDDNLPSIVEKLVRAEIERVARGGRG